MFQKALQKILIWGLALVLIIPLLMGKHFLFPFVTVKTFFFYILVDILFACYLWLLAKKKLYPPRSKLWWLFLGLIGIYFISDIFGINFSRSFWGNYERMMGLYTWLHLLIYLWMLMSVYQSRAKFLRLLDVSVIVSLLVSVYGLLQKFGLYFWLVFKTDDVRVYSTLGNAAYLAGYLLVNIFLALYLFGQKKSSNWRIFYGLVVVINLFVLLATATRGALVGLGAALLVMFFYALLFGQSKKARLVSGILLCLITLGAVGIFALKDSPLIKNNLALQRLSQISLQEGTTRSRLILWQMAWQGSKERLVFGYGGNNLAVPLDKYHNFELAEDWFDSSHNQFFDTLLAHGIVGLMAYVLFLFFVFRQLIKERRQDLWLSLVFLGLLTGYLVQNLFLFDTLPLLLLFVLVLGFLSVKSKTQQVFTPEVNRADSGRFRPRLWPKLAALVVLALAWLIYSEMIPPTVKVVQAQKYIKVDIDKTISMFDEAVEQAWFGYDNLAPLIAENTLMILKESERYTPEQLQRYMAVVTKVYQKALESTNNYSNFSINLAKLYQQARAVNPNFVDESITLLKQAQALSPGRVDIYFALAQGYFYQGKPALAEEALRETLEISLYPQDVYLKLADIQMRAGEPADGLESLKKAEELGAKLTFERWESLAQILVQREKWNDLLPVFFKMLEFQPYNTDILSNIALTYKKIGNRAKAREYALKILEIDPSMKPAVDDFLRNL